MSGLCGCFYVDYHHDDFESFANLQNVVKEEPEVKLEDNLLLDANNGGTAFLSKAMAEEEKKLLEARVKEEEILANEAGHLNEIQFFKV